MAKNKTTTLLEHCDYMAVVLELFVEALTGKGRLCPQSQPLGGSQTYRRIAKEAAAKAGKLLKAAERSRHPLDALVGKRVVHQSGTEPRDVVLLAIAGRSAMVRRPGCIAYTCGVDELRPPEETG